VRDLERMVSVTQRLLAQLIGKLHGKKYHGFVVRISDTDFEIIEVDRKTNYTFQYSEVKEVDEGNGEKGPLGNRVGRRGRLFGLIAGLSVAVALPVVLLALARCGEPRAFGERVGHPVTRQHLLTEASQDLIC
jgi:tetrahydromethanopterin S-methyltransferase subunit G